MKIIGEKNKKKGRLIIAIWRPVAQAFKFLVSAKNIAHVVFGAHACRDKLSIRQLKGSRKKGQSKT